MRVLELTALEERKKRLEKQGDAIEASCEPYVALFSGRKAAEYVLQDLAVATGYFTTLPDTATEAELRAHNARRAIFELIINKAELNGSRVAAIGHALAVAETSLKIRNA